MCGIIGLINSESEIEVEPLIHRGPDSYGVFENDNVKLGHTRLSIQDLTSAASQPMQSEDGNYVLIFNGEIYNHREIRLALEEKGISFKTEGDTETVLYALINYGKEALKEFNGIFALSFYDIPNQTLLVARDRFGVKPLYYSFFENSMVFSSEIKALMRIQGIKKDINIDALEQYVRFLWCPGTETAFSYVKKLLPGQMIIMELGMNKFDYSLSRFHDFVSAPLESKMSEQEWIELLDKTLEQAVRRQLLSDVPVGFFLSGGLDSSLIVAMARKIMPEKAIKCFTIDTSEFGDSEGFSNDLYYARKVAKHLKLDLEIVNSDIDILEDFDKMVWHLDEPQADIAPLHVYNISKRAECLGIKVLLGGTGGDDLFSGYRRHEALGILKKLEKTPPIVLTILKSVLQLTPINKNRKRRILRLLNALLENGLDKIFALFEWIPYHKSRKLFATQIKNKRFGFFYEITEKENLNNFTIDDLLNIEKRSFLVDHNLNYTDKMGMATGVEIRVPFLDNELEKFAHTIPENMKIKNNQTKYLLKKVAERYLPQDVIYREKAGFGGPVRKWVNNELQERISMDLSQERLKNQGIFNAKEVGKLIDNNKLGKVDASYSILALLSIQSWINQYITSETNYSKSK